MPRRLYITAAIPYVNGEPHLGHALELVLADVLARHARLRGAEVRFQTGADENALKNVAAARAAGVDVRRFVRERSDAFEALREPLQLGSDDFIRTAEDPRHRPGVERLWRACAAAGDLYRETYEGRYCLGCEAFLGDDELVDGLCGEHGTPPERVAEENWFFRLSRHAGALAEAIGSGALRVEPAGRRREVEAVLRAGLEDVSVSRPRERAGGWGIPVPGDPGQVVYVWLDALANYVTALGYGDGGAGYRRWWCDADERVHVVGKGIVRFHALLWPALLRSAGEPLPSTVFVHEYVTVEGHKLAKSSGADASPTALAARHGSDALRWWVVRDGPVSADADFRAEQLARRAAELADGVGNLVSRTVALVARGHEPAPPGDRLALPALEPLRRAAAELPGRVDDALERFDQRAAGEALVGVAARANAAVAATEPWRLRRAAAAGDREADAALAAVLGELVDACALLARELAPFLPAASRRIEVALQARDPGLARSLFPKPS